MKIRCTVEGIEAHGDKVSVKLRGVQVGAAGWRSHSVATLLIDNVRDIGKQLHVGREVDIEVKPR